VADVPNLELDGRSPGRLHTEEKRHLTDNGEFRLHVDLILAITDKLMYLVRDKSDERNRQAVIL
jgi:hypothetical protein